MKKALKWILLGVVVAAVALFAIVWSKYGDQVRTLLSIHKADDYPLYQMTYYGDYGFDNFLEAGGAASDEELLQFISGRLLGENANVSVPSFGCTAFASPSKSGGMIYGRNFDFDYAPSMLVKTKPKEGYASVSTVNLAFLGYTADNLPSGGLNSDSFVTLAAPYLPCDGMNEKGVAISTLYVPEFMTDSQPERPTLNTTGAIRLVLDKAATAEEAVTLLGENNLYFSGNIGCHYLIADATGNTLIVEYVDGAMQVVRSPEMYQVASNFVAFEGRNIGEGGSEMERYEKAKADIAAQGGQMNREDCVNTLASVAVKNDEGESRLQWSVVYDLNNLNGVIFAHGNTSNLVEFTLK